MNIIEFKEQVYQRIVSQYMKDVRKTKLTWNEYKHFMWVPLPFISIYIALLFFKRDGSFLNGVLPISIMTASMFITFGIFVYLLENLKSIFNHKKESDKYWGTTMLSLPILTDEELKKYLKRTDFCHCKKEYTQEEIESLVMLTPEEIKDMKAITFNSSQKKYIVDKIKSGEQIDFYNLTYLVNISDENKKIENQMIKEQEEMLMKNNKMLLDCIGYKDEQEMEMGQSIPMKQKIKHLL